MEDSKTVGGDYKGQFGAFAPSTDKVELYEGSCPSEYTNSDHEEYSVFLFSALFCTSRKNINKQDSIYIQVLLINVVI